MELPPPTKPDESDCCGSGCRRCVFDVYEEEYKIWETKIKGISETSVGKPGLMLLKPDEYADVGITKIEQITADTNVYHLSEPLDNHTRFRVPLGQHVVVKADCGDGYITRPFTPVQIGELADKNLILVIKLYKTGKMSLLIDKWKVGDVVKCRGPVGSEIQYRSNKWDTVILIAAGTGITPMVNIIQTILCNDDDDTSIILLYACQTFDDILLKTNLDKWTEHWNFRVFYFLSREDKEQVLSKKRYIDNIFCQRIGAGSLKLITKRFNIKLSGNKVYSFICGPVMFEVDMQNHLLDCGMPRENCYRF